MSKTDIEIVGDLTEEERAALVRGQQSIEAGEPGLTTEEVLHGIAQRAREQGATEDEIDRRVYAPTLDAMLAGLGGTRGGAA